MERTGFVALPLSTCSLTGQESKLHRLVNADSDNPVTPELLEWSNTIFCMERSHYTKLSSRFKRHLGQAKIVCLGIPDDFDYMAPELIAILKAKVPRNLPGGRSGG